MKLTYWIAHVKNDHPCYSIRRKTRREVMSEVFAHGFESGETGNEWTKYYHAPVKVVVEYDNALDLVNQFLREGGCYEEYQSQVTAESKVR